MTGELTAFDAYWAVRVALLGTDGVRLRTLDADDGAHVLVVAQFGRGWAQLRVTRELLWRGQRWPLVRGAEEFARAIRTELAGQRESQRIQVELVGGGVQTPTADRTDG